MEHVPVLTKELLQYLNLRPNDNVVDGTVGNGGHAKIILDEIGPEGKLLGIDADAEQIYNTRNILKQYEKRVILINDSYANIKKIAKNSGVGTISVILLDLGYSSWHIDKSGKGFSFKNNESLDMRYGGEDLTAEIILNEWPEKELGSIFTEYGEERFSKQIAHNIVIQRKNKKIEKTSDLTGIIKEAIPVKFRQGRIHYATRVFQALRIAVNRELESLKLVLPDATDILTKGGKLAVISFHSLEDRIVKNFFKEMEKENMINIISKKPIVAGYEELGKNPRARSAKLRIGIKC
jgi:16S rRNA (cytosine1402-N4)-methyltransferase